MKQERKAEVINQLPKVEIEGNQIQVFISPEQLANRVKELADQISADYKNQELILIGVLKGSNVFLVDLSRELGTDRLERGRSPKLVKIGFVGTSSYGSKTDSSGEVKQTIRLDTDIKGKHIIIVEDIADTRITLEWLLKLAHAQNPASVRVCVALNKESRNQTNAKLDYVGFDIPDEFVVGYGLDLNEEFRNLPFVGILRKKS